MQQQRFAKILGWLASHEFLSVGDAGKLLGASPATVRRDLARLASLQLVERAHGGVQRRHGETDGMSPFSLREISHGPEKAAIARRAVSLLSSGDVVIIDGGTTTFQVVNCLPRFPLRIVTNSLRLSVSLGEAAMRRGNLEVLMTGGYLYPQASVLLGPQAAATLRNYQAHWAFLSVEGISENGFSNTNEQVVEVERTMMAQAEKTVVLADRSKFGRRSMCHLCDFSSIEILVTNATLRQVPLLRTIGKQGVRILHAGA